MRTVSPLGVAGDDDNSTQAHTTSAHGADHDTRSFDMAVLKLGSENGCAPSRGHDSLEKRGLPRGVVGACVER